MSLIHENDHINFGNYSLLTTYSSEKVILEEYKVMQRAGYLVRYKKVGHPQFGPDGDYDNFGLYVISHQLTQAREFRRGYKVGLAIKGHPEDFVNGIRAAVAQRKTVAGTVKLEQTFKGMLTGSNR